jgi:hypothetical protein
MYVMTTGRMPAEAARSDAKVGFVLSWLMLINSARSASNLEIDMRCGVSSVEITEGQGTKWWINTTLAVNFCCAHGMIEA